MWCGQNWLAGSQSGVRKSIGGGLIKFSPNGTSLSPAITGFTGWEWTASGGVRPWHSTKSGSGHPKIAHGVQSDSASADPDLKGFHLGRIVGGKTQDRIRLVADGLVRFVNSSLEHPDDEHNVWKWSLFVHDENFPNYAWSKLANELYAAFEISEKSV